MVRAQASLAALVVAVVVMGRDARAGSPPVPAQALLELADVLDDAAVVFRTAAARGAACESPSTWRGREVTVDQIWAEVRPIATRAKRAHAMDLESPWHASLTFEASRCAGEVGLSPDDYYARGRCSAAFFPQLADELANAAAQLRRMARLVECARTAEAATERAAREQREADAREQRRAQEQEARERRRREREQADEELRVAREEERARQQRRAEAFEEARQVNATNAAKLAEVVAQGSSSASDTSEGAAMSKFTRLGFGVGLLNIPVVGETTTAMSTTTHPFSVLGVGLGLSLDHWPWYGPHFGLGLTIDAQLGSMMNAGGMSIAAQGRGLLEIYVGTESSVSLIARGGVGGRLASGFTSDDSMVIGGDARYRYVSGTVGPRLCLRKRYTNTHFCGLSLEVAAAIEQPSYATDRAIGYEGRLWAMGGLSLTVTVTRSYPLPFVAGAPTDESGTYVLVRLELKQLDIFRSR